MLEKVFVLSTIVLLVAGLTVQVGATLQVQSSGAEGTSSTTAGFVPPACGQCPPPYTPPCMQFPAPDTTSMDVYEAWLNNIGEWKKNILAQFEFSDAVYHIPGLKWTQTAYMAPQMHPFDLYFYDPWKKNYTLDRWINDVTTRYGGVEAILLWPTYPNIGVDDRNQFDWFRSLPGGLEKLKWVVQELKTKHNIRVMLPYNPWDSGTHREPTSDPKSVARILKHIEGYGINGDTMVTIPEAFFTDAMEIGVDIALQPEISGLPSSMNWTTMGWGYWNYPNAPCVDSIKFLESRRLTSVCNRWAKDKTDDLQNAFINGVGYVPWENVWGTWNGITPRGATLIERVATMLRYFGLTLSQGQWWPRYPCTQDSCFSSRWAEMQRQGVNTTTTATTSASSDGGAAVATGGILTFLVNRGDGNISGPVFHLPATYDPASWTVTDCYHGELATVVQINDGRYTVILKSMEPWGLGCILASPSQPENQTAWNIFLGKMRHLSATPIADYNNTWVPLLQRMEKQSLPSKWTTNYSNMALVSNTTQFQFECQGVEIEGPPGYGVDFQFPWEPYPQRHHNHTMTVGAFYMDVWLATNEDWANYVEASGYAPQDGTNYLRFWNETKANGTGRMYPAGAGRQPVTWISHREAAGYCNFYGKRLPHAWEWQYAAQGLDGRLYPWGNSVDPAAMPTETTGTAMPLPPNADAFPASASPFGVEALVGLVYQWTDVWVDAHTRAGLVKGGSYYRPSGSGWYYRPAKQVNQHNKYLMMDDSYDRAGTIGFRCVVPQS